MTAIPKTELLGSASILIVDDEEGMRNFLSKTLSPLCATVDVARTAAEATERLDAHRYDVVVLDNIMPGQSGIDWLAGQRSVGLFSDTILMTAFADLETAIAALRAGAADFLLKPFRTNQVINAIARSLDRASLKRENQALRHELGEGSDILRRRTALLGSSARIQSVRDLLCRSAAANSNVLIRGEVGSGKQVAARMLHAESGRSTRPFMWVPCGAYSDTEFTHRLLGTLDYGSTDSDVNEGIFMTGDGGVVFLDDVDKLSVTAQALLYEVISTKRYRPINATRSVGLDVRFVSSTTQSLQEEMRAGRFREDLYYLLNVVDILIPPLRERASDVLDLARFFIDNLAKEMDVEPPDIPPSTRRRLVNSSWRGNVMELRNHIERALIHGDLEYGLDFDPEEHETETLAAVERRHILMTLEACGGNRAKAARRLGIARKTIDRKCQAWNI